MWEKQRKIFYFSGLGTYINGIIISLDQWVSYPSMHQGPLDACQNRLQGPIPEFLKRACKSRIGP